MEASPVWERRLLKVENSLFRFKMRVMLNAWALRNVEAKKKRESVSEAEEKEDIVWI